MKGFDYRLLSEQIGSLTEGVSNRYSNMANISSCIFYALEDVSWAGFYILENDSLILGPFQDDEQGSSVIQSPRGIAPFAAAKE